MSAQLVVTTAIRMQPAPTRLAALPVPAILGTLETEPVARRLAKHDQGFPSGWAPLHVWPLDPQAYP